MAKIDLDAPVGRMLVISSPTKRTIALKCAPPYCDGWFVRGVIGIMSSSQLGQLYGSRTVVTNVPLDTASRRLPDVCFFGDTVELRDGSRAVYLGEGMDHEQDWMLCRGIQRKIVTRERLQTEMKHTKPQHPTGEHNN